MAPRKARDRGPEAGARPLVEGERLAMSARPSLLEALRHEPVVFDGAMGTQLYERGNLYTQNFDHLCVTRAEIVRSIHSAYVAAGAEVIQTNTFGANYYRLRSYELERDVEAINRAGVRLAREAAPDQWVSGSIGPTGLMLDSVADAGRTSIRDAYRLQAEVLLDEGVDALTIETFRQVDEIELALEAVLEARARSRAAETLVIASVSYDAFGTMADGTGPEDTARRLAAKGAGALGVNCADGPAGVYEMAVKMLDAGLPVIARPNAGLPRRVEGRFAYMATPEYFLLYARRMLRAGVRGIGGCCGTTAEHVKQMAAAARMFAATTDSPAVENIAFVAHETQEGAAPGIVPATREEKGPFAAQLGRNSSFPSK